jgi:quinol monooxygenase YgiN
MHIQVTNFNLKGIDDAQFRELCDQFVPAITAMPGLIYKVWLVDRETNTYGGIYAWSDRQAMGAFRASELFQAITAHPNLANFASRDFSIIEGPTRATNGFASVPV